MTGGKVTETIDVPATQKDTARVWVNCEASDETSVAVCLEFTAAARCVQPGDNLEWKGDTAYWTPKRLYFRDYKLKRMEGVSIRRPGDKSVTKTSALGPKNRAA